MTPQLPERLELRQRMYIVSPTQRRALWVSGVLFLALVALGLFLLFRSLPHGDRIAAAMLDGVRKKFVAHPLDALGHSLIFVALIPYSLYLFLAIRRERLILTPAGIEYRSPLPAALQGLRPGWSIAWGQIRSVTLKSLLYGRGPQVVSLELDAGSRKVKLYPYQWVDPNHYQPLSPWREKQRLQRATPEEIANAIYSSEILRYLAAVVPQLVPPREQKFASAYFALEKNPRSLAVVIAFFVLLFYALGDTFVIGHETYAAAPPYNLFIATGVLAALAAALWMRRGQVPLPETLMVALLFGGTFGAAGYPGALRLNALTDSDGLRTYQYRLTRERQFEPLAQGLPTLAFPQYYEYWAQFETGSLHEFELRKGGLGFYQLDMRPVNEALHDFYATQNAGRRRVR